MATSPDATASTRQKANTGLNSPMTEKAAEVTHQAVDTVAEKAAAAEDKLRKTAASSQETLAQKQQDLKKQLQQSYNKGCEMAAQHPLATAGLAFAAGVVLTALLRRR
jgi:ElaB/YqjD/DUF883 family membrane-anchored ribosome-binding protein